MQNDKIDLFPSILSPQKKSLTTDSNTKLKTEIVHSFMALRSSVIILDKCNKLNNTYSTGFGSAATLIADYFTENS